MPCEGKRKVHPRTGHEGPDGKKSGTTLSLTSALGGGGWSMPRPRHFAPGKDTQYRLYRRLGGPQVSLDRCGKSRPQPEFDPRTAQPVASRYTDWAILAHIICGCQYQYYMCHEQMRTTAVETLDGRTGIWLAIVVLISNCQIIFRGMQFTNST